MAAIPLCPLKYVNLRNSMTLFLDPTTNSVRLCYMEQNKISILPGCIIFPGVLPEVGKQGRIRKFIGIQEQVINFFCRIDGIHPGGIPLLEVIGHGLPAGKQSQGPRLPEYKAVSWKCFILNRSEERRVGKECRSRWSPEH